jgi:hypothetical protein
MELVSENPRWFERADRWRGVCMNRRTVVCLKESKPPCHTCLATIERCA